MWTEMCSRIGQVISQYREVPVVGRFSEGRSMVCMCVPVSGEACGLGFFLCGIRLVLVYACLKHRVRKRGFVNLMCFQSLTSEQCFEG